MQAEQIVFLDATYGLAFGQTGKLSDDDMSKLTALFIDAAEENVDALPKRLAEYDPPRGGSLHMETL